jgi:hypothetical protein
MSCELQWLERFDEVRLGIRAEDSNEPGRPCLRNSPKESTLDFARPSNELDAMLRKSA